VRCSSIAADGSDFTIVGPQGVTIAGVTYNCNNNNPQAPVTTEVQINLTSPITAGGVYAIFTKNGNDGNPIADECGNWVPIGARIPFVAQPSVSAAFTYTVRTSCIKDTVHFQQTIPASVSHWRWELNGTLFSDIPNPVKVFSTNGDHAVRLIVSNGTCNDTAQTTIALNNKVTAGFNMPAVICPEDTLHVANTSSSNSDRWHWDFGGGVTSQLNQPLALRYPITGREAFYTVKLVSNNSAAGCADSVSKKVRVLSGCYIDVPTAFTPNDDGLNDYLQPLNALKADRLLFRVYNRFGQLVFESRDWTAGWNGKVGGIRQASGVYAWFLSFTHKDTGEKIFRKGTTVLIR
jgi:gliding motility-associated-like protein